MRKLTHLGVALVVALFAFFFLTHLVSAASPAATYQPSPSGERAAYSIAARRFTSIPFGIAETANLNNSGQQVAVSGHTGCPQGGESFVLVVKVVQGGTVALGQTAGNCADDAWTAEASTRGGRTLSAGEANVCAVVFISGDFEGLAVRHWCKDVTLQ